MLTASVSQNQYNIIIYITVSALLFCSFGNLSNTKFIILCILLLLVVFINEYKMKDEPGTCRPLPNGIYDNIIVS